MKVQVYTDVSYSPRTVEAIIAALKGLPPKANVEVSHPGVLRVNWEEER